MYASVVVLTYQSPDIDSFTYEVPKELEKEIQIGQLVEVPFGKRNPMGIIIATHDRHPRESEDQILNPFNVQVKQVQDDNGGKKIQIRPISKILLNLPVIPPYQIDLAKWMSAYYFAPMVNCLNTILPELPSRLLTVHSSQNSINRQLSTVNQTLVLVPSLNKIAETLAKFPKAKNYVVYHNELKTSEKFATWMKILSGTVDYIFGSRSAIFAPCPNLKEIIIYDEHDNAYKDARSPYFDTLTVAQKIAQLTRAQVKIVDPSPKITTFSILKNFIKIQKFAQIVEIINMQNERASGNKSPFSYDLVDKIKTSKNVLLFLNKKKESGHIYCQSCKQSQFLNAKVPNCPNCKSQNIFFFSLNINSLSIEAKKLFPNHKSIEVGTAQVLYAPLLQKYDLIAHIQADTLINRADFTSEENLYQQAVALKKLLKENGKLILQTYNPDNTVFKFIANNDYHSFYSNQLAQRKLLSFPPYSLFVKLTIKGKDEEKTKNEAETLASELRSSLPAASNQRPVTSLGPYKTIFWKKQSSYSIILKYKLGSYSQESREKAQKEVANLLPKLSKNWQIVVEPASIN